METIAHILIVEDSPEDYEMAVRALRKAGATNPIHHCSDGDDALDFLHRRGRYADRPEVRRPALVILDLNMPGTDGREVLEQMKSDERLRSIPVVVLTTSADPRDVGDCYRSGANSFIQKPVDLRGLLEMIKRVKEYWLDVVILDKEAQ